MLLSLFSKWKVELKDEANFKDGITKGKRGNESIFINGRRTAAIFSGEMRAINFGRPSHNSATSRPNKKMNT